MLARSRYGKDLREEAGKAFIGQEADLVDAGNALSLAVYYQTVETEDNTGWAKAAERFIKMLEHRIV